MGREIVYCEGCGERLTEDDFTRGKARDHENRPFCSSCRPVAESSSAPSPGDAPEGKRPAAPSGKGTERRTANTTSRRRGATERVPYADAPPGTRRRSASGEGPTAAWIIGGIGAALAVVVVVGMAIGSQRPSLPPEATVSVKPSPDPAAELEARQARQKEKDRATEIERAKRQAAERDAAEKKAAADREAAEKKAAAEREAAEKKAAADKAAQKNWSDLFVLATSRIQANDYPGAKKIYLEGLATLPGTRPEDLQQRAIYCIGLYNLACISAVESANLTDAARNSSVDAAFKYLDWALRSDYGKFRCACHPQTLGVGHMGDDKDMDPLRKDARYAELLRKYK